MFLRIGRYLVLLLVALTTKVAAHLPVRDTSIVVSFYGVEEGLPHPEVSTIFRDSFGLMWLGTDGGGVSCFDAAGFINYYPNSSNSDSLCNGYIAGIAEDKSHNIWLATHDGVSCLNRSTMRFNNYPIDYTTRNGNLYKGVLAIYFDREGQCWLASMRGLGKFNTVTGHVEWYDFPFILNQQPSYLNNRILEDKDGNIWILVSGALLCWNKELKTYHTLESSQYETGRMKSEIITGFAFDSKYRLCVSTLNAIYVYRDAINLPFVYQLSQKDDKGQYASIDGFWLGNANELWCLVNKKIYFVDRETGEWLCINKIYTHNEQLGYVPNSSSNFENKDVYFLPVDGGFAVWTQKPLFFSQEILQPDYHTSLYNKKILSIYTSDDKEVWVGTANGCILRLDYTTDSITDYTPKHLTQFGGNVTVNSFYRFPTGELIGNTGHGALYFDAKTNSWNTHTPTPWLEVLFESLKDKSINKIEKLDREHYLFALDKGLLVYNYNTQKTGEIATLHGKNIQDLTKENTQSALCIANGRTYRLTISSPHSKPIVFCDSTSMLLAQIPSSICLAPDQEQSWIGTNDGLYLLPHTSDTCRRVSNHHFFKSNPINSLVCDSQGKVWIATERGIAEYVPTTHTLYIFGKNDGLYRTVFNRNASFISPQGQIYFGGQSGLTRFYARQNKEYEACPVLLTRLEIIGDGLSSMEIPTLTTRLLTIPHGYHSLTFRLSHLNYTSRQRARYQVMIEGLYERWSDVVSGNVLNMNNLPPGTFTLRFQSSLNGEIWTEGSPYQLIISDNSGFLCFIRKYLLLLTLLFLIVSIIFVRRFLLDRRGKINERIRSAMRLEALNQELQHQTQIMRSELRNARHTQDVILPTIETIRHRCPDSFILFKPLREVSGDIFWYSEHKHYIYLGVIDCTGHETAAAIMSLIIYVFLHNIIVERHTTGAAKILTLLSNSLYERNTRICSAENINEGVDVSICVVDTEHRMIDFAGAFHRIIHCHENQTDVYIGNPTFVGNEHNESFSSRIIHYTSSDFLYLFSDGYSDQLGGEYAKKMRFARFKGYLEAASRLPIMQQEQFLLDSLTDWQGANAQYDDITILGFQCTFKKFIGQESDTTLTESEDQS